MKSQFLFPAIALALLAFHGQSHAQQASFLAAQGEAEPVFAGYQVEDSMGESWATSECEESESCAACACDECYCDPCCCPPTWQVFGDFLYIRARDVEVAYAVPIDGPVDDPDDPKFQIGPTAVADFDYEPAFRAGFSTALGDCGRLGATYTFFETQTSSSTSIPPPDLIHTLISHPDTPVSSQQFLAASAEYSLDFDLVDLDFTRVLSCGPGHQLTCLLGARYAGLEQDFLADFTINGQEIITTDISFDGGGIRVGLDAEWYDPCRGWLVYGRGAASFVAGQFRAMYLQDDLYGQQIIYTDWEAGRLVTMLDLEVGLGWTSRKGGFRVTGGYMVSGWFNTVNTDEFINAVQTDEFTGLNGSMTFDGLVTRAEFRF